ncbi:glycosyltransferase [Ferrimonas gelatinilytica]|uniref:Glycosyltransferase 2-like domain-containing protein n=1 Tax=Ferrimonas gelatinilytica TaxID=1255257 RepID=A0ABP9SDT7_9GAMM
MADLPYRKIRSARTEPTRCRLSVLMATTGGATLSQALLSVLDCQEETLATIELVLVVDNPNLDPSELLTPLSEPQRAAVTLLHNDENIGLTRSLNLGLQFCRGALVTRLDDDDRFTPQRIALVTTYFSDHPDVDLLTGAAWVHQDGRRYLMQVPESHLEIARRLACRNILVHSALTVRTERLRWLGGYDEAFRYAQDYEFYLRALRQGLRFAGVSEPLVEREEGRNSITLSRRRQQALFSLAALSLHHALCWDGGAQSVRPVLLAVARFASPSLLRKGVRWLRARRRRVRLA